MSTKSFYVAASSSPGGVSAARALASRLEGAGLTNAMPWWDYLEDPVELHPDLAMADVDSVRVCGVFVLLAPDPNLESLGAHVELGARLGAGREAFLLGPGGHYLFRKHPLVKRVESVDVLLAVLAGGEARRRLLDALGCPACGHAWDEHCAAGWGDDDPEPTGCLSGWEPGRAEEGCDCKAAPPGGCRHDEQDDHCLRASREVPA